MRADPHPQQHERLQALRSYNILDTPRESDFDDIVALAAAICEAPISVVNLIDEHRQWFKAEVGLGARETPLETSLCSHVILENDLVEIPDTLADPRMADNPLCLDDPGLRFYAGAQLVADNGLPIGTLCVLGNEPRVLNDLQRQALKVLAQQVMHQLELRKSLRNEEILRAEMDHRIKNSLQATSSLIRIYTRAIEDEGARDALNAVQRRIDAMSALHEQLQKSSSSGTIHIARYLSDLTDILRATVPDGTSLTLTCDDNIHLPSKDATDLGVILSEFIANSIKHGFTEGRQGNIAISLTTSDEGKLLLQATDDGLGSDAPPPPPSRISGIGRSLVAAAASNLGGDLSNDLTEHGARLSLVFNPQ